MMDSASNIHMEYDRKIEIRYSNCGRIVCVSRWVDVFYGNDGSPLQSISGVAKQNIEKQTRRIANSEKG